MITDHCNFRNFMITKILIKKNLNNEKNYHIFIFSLDSDQKQKFRSMISSPNSIINRRKKRLVIEKIAKFDYIFDTKNLILCVVYDEIIDEKSFENLNIKFVILQTKEICQSFFNSKIVDNNKNA